MIIKDLKDSEVKDVLNYCSFLIGIDSVQSEAAKKTMLEYIRKTYTNVDADQIKKSFECLTNGDLGTELQQHFNNFSPMYLSKVINAYLIAKNKNTMIEGEHEALFSLSPDKFKIWKQKKLQETKTSSSKE